MNRFITIGIASTLAFASVAAVASARSTPSPSHFNGHDDSGDVSGLGDTEMNYGLGFYPNSDAVAHSVGVNWDVRHWQGRPFQIMTVEKIDRNGEAASVKDSEARRVARLQAAIEHNRALANRLTAENVNVHDVVGAKAATDGTMTFYVR